MRLWLLRHGPVDLPPGLCYGASDVPALAEPTQGAAIAFASLPAPGVPVWVSALGRARQLAQALQALRPDLGDPLVDARLNEMHFGGWELRPWDSLPRSEFEDWMAGFAHHRVGGDRSGESTQQVLDRVAAALDAALATQLPEMVWVTHAGVIRAVQYLIQPGRRTIAGAHEWPRQAPPPGGWLALSV